MSRPNASMHAPMRSRGALIAILIIVTATVMVFVDFSLAGRAEHLYRQAQQVAAGKARVWNMHRDVRKGWAIVHVDHVSAGLCYAFTGGLRFSVFLPRSRRIQDVHPTVSSTSGSCAPGDVNTLLFTFSAVVARAPMSP